MNITPVVTSGRQPGLQVVENLVSHSMLTGTTASRGQN